MNDVSHHYVTKEIPMLHSKLDDMSQNEAVIRYLQIVGQLPDYGYHFFEVSRGHGLSSNRNILSLELCIVITF